MATDPMVVPLAGANVLWASPQPQFRPGTTNYNDTKEIFTYALAGQNLAEGDYVSFNAQFVAIPDSAGSFQAIQNLQAGLYTWFRLDPLRANIGGGGSDPLLTARVGQLESEFNALKQTVDGLEVSNILASHFPMNVPVGNTSPPQDVNGIETATLLPEATYAHLWQEKGWLTFQNSTVQAVRFSQPLDINTRCCILAFELNVKSGTGGSGGFAGNAVVVSPNQTFGNGFFLWNSWGRYVFRLDPQPGTATDFELSATMPVGSTFNTIIAVDGPNKGIFIWVNGTQIVGISAGAWTASPTNDAPLRIGRGYNDSAGESSVYRIRNLCIANLAVLPSNLNAIANAYSNVPGLGLSRMVF